MSLGQVLAYGAALAGALAVAAGGNGYQVYLDTMVALTTMVGIGLNVLLGLTGQVSLGHVGFFAIGAYTSAILAAKLGIDLAFAMPVAAVLAGLVGAVLALPALRVAGPYLAMVTIAFGFIVQNGAIEWRSLTGGANGLQMGPPVLFGRVVTSREIAVLAIALAALLLWLFDRLKKGGWGRAMRAVRASEPASQSLGLDLIAIRVTAFALSAAAAGLSGAVFAPLSGFIGPSGFTFFQSILFLLVVIIGGAGETAGPLVGAVIVVLLPQLGARFAEYQLLFFGAVLLLVLWLAPEGVVGALSRRRRAVQRVRAASGEGEVAAYLRRGQVGGGLVARHVAIAFGGVRAVSDVSFAAEPGRITSIIGPNGAGKSTLLNLLSGFYRPETGIIRIGDASLAALPAHRIARAGIARTFQTSQLFAGLSVADNVAVGQRGRGLGALFPLRGAAAREERHVVEALLGFVGFGGALDGGAADLPHVDKRLVEIARALATRPRVLLLDEPAAGLGESDTERLSALLRAIADLGIAVVLVEHDMGLVMTVSDHVVVLDAGRAIAAGPPVEVQRDPVVIRAYLGDGAFRANARAAPLPSSPVPALAVEQLRAAYSAVEVLRGVDLSVGQGELVAVLGANGAGKTTMMRALSGLLRPVTGAIRLYGAGMAMHPAHRRVRAGLVLVPEGRQVFAELSVLDNLRLGAFARGRADVAAEVETLLERFPVLRERRRQRAGLLSGGEQQMLALARGLIARPRVLLLDEPSLGLAPVVIDQLFTTLTELRDEGVTLLLVDQMAGMALALADRAYILEGGRITGSGSAAQLAQNSSLREAYLGQGSSPS